MRADRMLPPVWNMKESAQYKSRSSMQEAPDSSAAGTLPKSTPASGNFRRLFLREKGVKRGAVRTMFRAAALCVV